MCRFSAPLLRCGVFRICDGDDNLVRSLDFIGKKEYNYTYQDGTLVRAAEAAVEFTNDIVTQRTLLCVVSYHYDGKGTLKRKVITPTGGDTMTLYFETVDDKTVVKYTAGGKTVTVHSGTDSFGRKTFDEIQTGAGFLTREFDYLAGEVTEEHLAHDKLKSSPTTQLVSRIVFSDGRELEYEYDAEERITKVTDSAEGVTEYTYDALGQLLTERVNGHVVNSMTYDGYGNILSKNGKIYTYANVWKDLLLSVDGTPITYDAQGNPTSYLGHALTWEKGRRLKRYGSTYLNYDGPRCFYIGNTSLSFDHADRIVSDNVLCYLYDESGNVFGCIDRATDTKYLYQRDALGNIIAVLDNTGALVVQYKYDAWGNFKILDASGAESTDIAPIGHLNGFRYRGYYYCSEIGLYYLKSRFYDPVVGRFINADSVEYLDPSSVNGLNLYAYCLNNPVMYFDPFGNSIIASLIILGYFAIAGGIIGGFLGANAAKEQGLTGVHYAAEIVHGVFKGIVCGLAVGGAFLVFSAGIAAVIGHATIFTAGVQEVFALGSLAINSLSIFGPLFGIETEPVEYDPSTPYVPSPNVPYNHPALK